jgi:hypothetical protein
MAMRLPILTALALLAACASHHPPVALGTAPGAPQDTVSVAYLSGGVPTPNWKNTRERPYGRLVLGDSAMALESDGGTLLFVLPFSDVSDATAKAEQRNATFITGAGRDEYVTVRIERAGRVDVLTFGMRRAFTADATAAKITQRIRR